MILILAAMHEELDALKDLMIVEKEHTVKDLLVYEGLLGSKKVLLSRTGIGKVGASYTSVLLTQSFDVSLIINIGSAGGLGLDQEVGDIVLAQSASHHDRLIARKQLDPLTNLFVMKEHLIQHAKNTLKAMKFKYHTGQLISGDQFLSEETPHYSTVYDNFPNAIAVDMESGSIAEIANRLGIDCIIIRSLSDVVGSYNHDFQFDMYLKLAARNSAKIAESFIKNL